MRRSLTSLVSLTLAPFLFAACSSSSVTDAGSVTLGSGCNPDAVVDACFAQGYLCTVGDGGVATCGYPQANDTCVTSVGCDPTVAGLSCFDFSPGNDGGAVSFCGTPCDHPTDCLDSTADCFVALLPDGGQRGACLTNYCQTANAACSVGSGSPQGTCYPDGKFGDNVCHQSGPIATDNPCSASTIDGGAYLCIQGDFCGTGADGGDSACLVSCDPPSCPSTQSCVSDYKLCLTPCTQANPTCPSPFTCLALVGIGGTSLGDFCWLP